MKGKRCIMFYLSDGDVPAAIRAVERGIAESHRMATVFGAAGMDRAENVAAHDVEVGKVVLERIVHGKF